MEDQDPRQTVMGREGARRCELWNTGMELRVYVSEVLTYREGVPD
jgi:hypothetical protein